VQYAYTYYINYKRQSLLMNKMKSFGKKGKTFTRIPRTQELSAVNCNLPKLLPLPQVASYLELIYKIKLNYIK